jgi:hypothetical protein
MHDPNASLPVTPIESSMTATLVPSPCFGDNMR